MADRVTAQARTTARPTTIVQHGTAAQATAAGRATRTGSEHASSLRAPRRLLTLRRAIGAGPAATLCALGLSCMSAAAEPRAERSAEVRTQEASGAYATGAPSDPDAETYVGWASARDIDPAQAPWRIVSDAAIPTAAGRDIAPAPTHAPNIDAPNAAAGSSEAPGPTAGAAAMETVSPEGGLAEGGLAEGDLAEGGSDGGGSDRGGFGHAISRLLGRSTAGDSGAPVAHALERRSAHAARRGVMLELTSIATGRSVRVVAVGRLDPDEGVDIAVPPDVAVALGADIDAPFLVLVEPAP